MRVKDIPNRETQVRYGVGYLTIIPQARVGYEMVDSQLNEAHSAELAIIISHPTRASGIIVLLKTPQNILN